MAKRTTFKPCTFETVGGDKRHAAIYISLLFSPAFQSLSNRQQLLYIYAKGRYYGTRKPGRDFPEVKELQGNDLFYFPFKEAVNTGKYTANMRREFYGDMKRLEDAGFICCVARGKRNQKTIYRYSSLWQNWKPE